ncbi:MAG: Fe-S cluster assembly protein SufD [Prevotellaceae bacterium]|jgi:Fe-S cluster assembly protein SufD|nr:Fe-S cluster assembly protein SufD [Prevotellaceae bacterium]
MSNETRENQMTDCSQLKPLTTRFYCDVPGLDTEKIYLMNGAGVGKNTGEQGVRLDFNHSQTPKPIQIISVREGHAFPEVQVRNTVTVEAGVSASLILCDHTTSDFAFVTETWNEFHLAEGAQLRILMMQNEHNTSTHTTNIKVQQEKHSFFSCTLITLHGGTIENRFEVTLQGEQAECALNGLFLCDGAQRITNAVRVRHAVSSCRSNQLFKGLLDDRAVGYFNGHIRVDKDAQKTEAMQENHNMLLAPAAKMYIQPHLEIYADDVKCAHGATIGRIDENALFYLRSRGISLAEAQFLQQFAFAHDVIERITLPPLRERIADLVGKRLRGELHPCAGCARHCC